MDPTGTNELILYSNPDLVLKDKWNRTLYNRGEMHKTTEDPNMPKDVK